eukprot:sb/3474380/
MTIAKRGHCSAPAEKNALESSLSNPAPRINSSFPLTTPLFHTSHEPPPSYSQVFSDDHSGNMSFSDYLDMLSVMSLEAPKDLKSAYAFKIYDFNDDGMIDRTDLEELVNRVTGDRMRTEDVDGIVDNILKECDLDENE